MRDEVQAASGGENTGTPTGGGTALGALGGTGYGKVDSCEHPPADIEMSAPQQHLESAALDSTGMLLPESQQRRHIGKKICVVALLLLLLGGGASFAMRDHSEDDSAPTLTQAVRFPAPCTLTPSRPLCPWPCPSCPFCPSSP